MALPEHVAANELIESAWGNNVVDSITVISNGTYAFPKLIVKKTTNFIELASWNGANPEAQRLGFLVDGTPLEIAVSGGHIALWGSRVTDFASVRGGSLCFKVDGVNMSIPMVSGWPA